MGAWLRLHTARDNQARHRLVCFPHAGGTAHSFATWPQYMPVDVETVVVQYPGRQDRVSEPCIESMDEMADVLAAELADLTDLPMTMFGHSMGSAIAYEVALRLERDLGFVVETVFASARTAPHRSLGEDTHRLNDDDLVTAMRLLGGMGHDVYDHPQLWPMILPPLRSDLRLLDNYRPEKLVRLRAPFVALGGEEDPTCSVADLEAWNAATSGGLEVQIFAGGHHYIATNEAAVTTEVARNIARRSSSPTPRPGLDVGHRSPTTPTEQKIVDMWAKHLGMSGIGADDDFFSLGGHSLVGMKILDDIKCFYNVDIGPVEFYLQPTPSKLAAKIDLEVGAL